MQITQQAVTLNGVSTDAPFRAVWETATDAMALSDPGGIVVAANPAYYSLYGYGADEVIGHSFAIIFPPEERDTAIEAYHHHFFQGVSTEGVESTVRRKNGELRRVDVRYSFIEHEGHRVAMLSIIRDVTDHARLRDAERE